jgi:Inner membrane component of T3SS, cytoplasmic domain
MVVLTEKKSSSLVQGRAASDLSLRIVGTLRDGQIVRLSAPKCTIGSAKGCTLRLRCAAVQPLHCLILRGSLGTVVRSWSARTRLNGQRFSDALLVAGDRLKIGPIELEVLSSSLTGQKLVEQESGQRQAKIEPQTIFGRQERKGHRAAWQQHRVTEEAQSPH